MTDIAALGFSIDSRQAEKAADTLERMAVAGDRAEAAVGRVSAAMRRMGSATSGSSGARRTSDELDRAKKSAESYSAALDRIFNVNRSAASGGATTSRLMKELEAWESAKRRIDQIQSQARYGGMFGIGRESKSARESADVFKKAFEGQERAYKEWLRKKEAMDKDAAQRAAAINLARAQQEGKNFREAFEASMGIGRKATSNGATFSALSELVNKTSGASSALGRGRGTGGGVTNAQGANGRRVSNELTNLSFQLNDIVTGLATGQSPLMVAGQQGGQILQIFQTAQGGPAALAKTLLSAIRPLPVAIGAVGAAMLTAAFAANRWENAHISLRRALSGTGLGTGASTSDLMALADASAARSGASTAGARSTLGALAQTGSIPIGSLGAISDLARPLAHQLGVELSEANKILAESFKDPVRGAELLNERLGGLSSRTMDQIREATASGDRLRANGLLMDTFGRRIASVADTTSVWTRAWEALGAASSRVLDRIGQGITEATRANTPVEALEKELATLEARTPTSRSGRSSVFGVQIRNPLQEIAQEGAARDEVNLKIATTRRLLQEAREAQDNLNRAAMEEREARRARDEQARVYREAGESAQQLGIPEAAARKNIDDLIEGYRRLTLARAMAYGNQSQEGGGERYREITERQSAARRALQDVTGGARIYDRDNFGVLTESNEQIRARALSLQDRAIQQNDVERQSITAVTAAQRASAQVAQAQQQAREQGAGAGSEALVALRARIAGENELLRINHQLTQAGIERIRSARDNVETAKVEVDTIGRSIAESERMRTEQQLLTEARREYRRLGLQMPQAEIDMLKEQARALGEVRQKQAEVRLEKELTFERNQMGRSDIDRSVASRLREIYGESYGQYMESALGQQLRFNEQLRLTGDLLSGVGTSIFQEMRAGKSAVDAVTNAFGKMADRLVSMALDWAIRNLLNQLMGNGGGGGFGGFMSSYGGGGGGGFGGMLGGLGGLLGSIFGGGAMNLGGFMNFGGGGMGVAGAGFGLGSWYDKGGFTGHGSPSSVAGVVHKKEYVFSAPAVQRLGLPYLESLHRGFASGGYTGGASSGGGGGWGMPNITINTPPDTRARTKMGPNGNLQVDIMSTADAALADKVSRGEGKLVKAVGSRFARPQIGGRG